MTNTRRSAFTLIELLVVFAIVAVIGIVTFFNLNGGKQSTDVSATGQQMVALANEAQSRAASQNQNSVWGIHFANSTNTAPFYALFTGSSYSTATTQSYYRLPATVAYATSTVPSGSSVDVTFSPVSGHPSSPATITIVSTQNPSIVENVLVNSVGLVSYSSPSSQNIWVSDAFNNRVEKFNSAGTYVSQLGCGGSGGCASSSTNGMFYDGWFRLPVGPSGVAIDASGNIWVTDPNNNRVEKFNSSGVYQSQLGCASGTCAATSTNGMFNGPFGVAIDASGNIWVTDYVNNRVEMFNSAGTYVSQLGCATGACATSSTNGMFSGSDGVAIDASGNIWVTDYFNSRVEKFNSAGTYVSQLGCGGSGGCAGGSTNGMFYGPYGVAIDASGNIWVTDDNNNRVQEFNSSGVYQSQLGCTTGACAATSTNGGFNGPYGIAIH
jgi:type II secretory pathway pseudopilin PulG